jgi:hypothetical protein
MTCWGGGSNDRTPYRPANYLNSSITEVEAQVDHRAAPDAIHITAFAGDCLMKINGAESGVAACPGTRGQRGRNLKWS